VGSSTAASKAQEMGGSGMTPSSLLFPIGGEGHRHLQKKKNTRKFLVLSPFFQIYSFVSFFGSLFFPSLGGRFDGCRSGGDGGRCSGRICQCLKALVWRRSKCLLGAGNGHGSVRAAMFWLPLDSGQGRERWVSD
jgi:hypothetical protein